MLTNTWVGSQEYLTEKTLFTINSAGITGYSYTKEWNYTLILYPSQKLTQKIEDLNVWPQNMKLLKENTRIKLLDMDLGKDFFGYDTQSSSKNKK